MYCFLHFALMFSFCLSHALAADWTLERRTSSPSRNSVVSVSVKTGNMSLGGMQDASKTVQLIVQCGQNTVSVLVAFSDSLAFRPRQSVRLGYRIGEDTVPPAQAGVSGNGRATGWWTTPDALLMIEKMKRERELARTVEGDRSAQARFPLRASPRPWSPCWPRAGADARTTADQFVRVGDLTTFTMASAILDTMF